MSERVEFIGLYRSGHYAMSELCCRFEVSRPTGYKWVKRFEAEGLEGLRERSRRPHRSPNRTPKAVEDLVVEARQKHPDWGPITIVDYLRPRHAELSLPAPSTVGEILKRKGLLVPKARRPRSKHPGVSSLKTEAPNQVWSADFKGEFRLLDGQYCYPLTIADAHSRYLLGCYGLSSTMLSGVRPLFELVFATYGLPEAIRTDNGTPFVTPALCGLSQLSVWWTKLGIIHQRIRPGRPQENGRHERMHRTMKAATTLPRAANAAEQQIRFDAFVEEYNNIRPHRALEGVPPASVYEPSARSLPSSLEPPHYPDHWELRRVSSDGFIKFKGNRIFLSTTLAGEQVALNEKAIGLWSIYFHHRLLARFDEQSKHLA